MKYLITIIALLAISSIAFGASILPANLQGLKPQRPAVKTLSFLESATSSKNVSLPQFTITLFDSELSVQGACLKLKDSDGVGYTYLTVNDGVASFSVESCE